MAQKKSRIEVLCYPRCSTCKKALKWLDDHGVEYTMRDIVIDNPTAAELAAWHEKSGLPLRRFFNTSGMVYRELDVKTQLDAGLDGKEAYALLATNGMLVKRPLVIAEDAVLIGFREAEWEKALLQGFSVFAVEGSFYITVAEPAEAEIIEKKSRFIARVAPARTESEALACIEEVRAAHRMARHHVYAYVVREDARVRYSDDGEPQKTAGIPTLEVLTHANLTDVVMVTTRYFGGTLLGTGGLVRAYTAAAQACLEVARIVTITRCVDVNVSVAYPLYDRVVHALESRSFHIGRTDFTDEVRIVVRVPAGAEDAVVDLVVELTNGSATTNISESFDAAL